MALSSAQEIKQKASPGLIDRKRVDFQLYFKHRKYSWSKCMYRHYPRFHTYKLCHKLY